MSDNATPPSPTAVPHPVPGAPPRGSGNATPRVSVVIPNYNHVRLLPSRIEWVLNQTLDDLEVTSMDDGSTDNSREVIARYADRPRVLLGGWAIRRGTSPPRRAMARVRRTYRAIRTKASSAKGDRT